MILRIGEVGLAGILATLIVGSANAEDPADATFLRKVLSQARIQALGVRDKTYSITLLENLAAAEARVGNLRLAESEADRLEPVVKAPPHYGNCNHIFEEILRAQARLGDNNTAYRTIQRIAGNKDEAYYALAQELAKKGEFDQARAAVEQTSRPDNVRRRAEVFLELATFSTRSGDLGRAASLFDQSESLSAKLLREAGVQAGTIELTLEVAARRRACGSAEAAARMFSESRLLIGGIADDSRRQPQVVISVLEI